MLSIKYFVSLAEILRFSLNWRTHLPNDVIFWIYFTSGHCLYGLYSICLCFLKFLVEGLNVIVQILCLFCWKLKIFAKLKGTSPKWRHLWNLFYVKSLPLWFVLHPFVFSKVSGVRLECYRSNTLSLLQKF